jgi:DNA-binding response OmpR family regulator
MDKRVLLLTADKGLGDLVRAQVENLGCRCTVADGLGTGIGAVDWAELAILDLATEELGSLRRLREEAPGVRTLVIAPDDLQAEPARNAGVEGILVEPFSIPELVTALREVDSPAAGGDDVLVDLRADRSPAAPVADDAPWWATR